MLKTIIEGWAENLDRTSLVNLPDQTLSGDSTGLVR
jgi:hypothetical protein